MAFSFCFVIKWVAVVWISGWWGSKMGFGGVVVVNVKPKPIGVISEIVVNCCLVGNVAMVLVRKK